MEPVESERSVTPTELAQPTSPAASAVPMALVVPAEDGAWDTATFLLRPSPMNITHLLILPALDACRLCYMYAALPLHYLDSGWPLPRLGLVITLACATRVLVTNPSIALLGPWMVAPWAIFKLALAVPMAMMPDDEMAVTVGVFSAVLGLFLDSYQSFNLHRFPEPQLRVQASRWVLLGDTLGYSVSPLVGGALYDMGGWSYCAYFQVALLSLESLLLSTSPVVWKLLALQLGRGAGVAPGAWAANDEAPPRRRGCPVGLPPARIRGPAAAVALASGVNIFVYSIEWVVFAAYYREEFDWNSSWWAGAAQMVGDIIGATVMVLQARPGKRGGRPSRCRSLLPQKLACLWSPPYHVSVLFLFWTVLHLGIAVPVFSIAVASQVAMGAVFVFMVQFVVELNTLYADGDVSTYLRLSCWSGTAFGIGTACSSTVGLSLYVQVGRSAPFFVAAATSMLGFIVYTAAFALRVGVGTSALPLKELEGQMGNLGGKVPGART